MQGKATFISKNLMPFNGLAWYTRLGLDQMSTNRKSTHLLLLCLCQLVLQLAGVSKLALLGLGSALCTAADTA